MDYAANFVFKRSWKCLIKLNIYIHSRVKPLSIKNRSSKPQRFKKDSRVFGDHDKDLISLGIDVDQFSVREYEETMDEISEDDYDKAIEHGHELYDMYQSDLKQEKKVTLRKILQRKVFRALPEPCLLTHAAKQQIRYLHQLDPDEWSPQLLAESFPISVDGVKKLLNNNFVLKDEEKIRAQDELVAQRWKQLMGRQSIGLSPSMNQRFLEGKLSPVCAAGNASLPLPTEKSIQIDTGKRKPTGQFLAIVKPYLELKETAALREKEFRESSAAAVVPKDDELTKHHNPSQKSNMKYSGNRKEKNGIDWESPETIKTSQKSHKNFSTSGKQMREIDSELYPSQKLEHSRENIPRNITLEELKKETGGGWNLSDSTKMPRYPICVTAEQFKDNLRKDLEKKQSNSEINKVVLKWLEDKDKEEDIPVVTNVSPSTYSSVKKNPENVKQYESNTIELTVDVNEDESQRDSYLYDSKHGYQHPVGKWDTEVENITIPKQLYKEGAVYRKGRSYYDDNGEFLYRVPIEVTID